MFDGILENLSRSATSVAHKMGVVDGGARHVRVRGRMEDSAFSVPIRRLHLPCKASDGKNGHTGA